MVFLEPLEISLSIIFPIIGYFVGTVNPGFFFGKMKGVDLRKVGTKNPGTSNTFRSLGLIYGIPTALYDTLKGLLVMLLAVILGVNLFFAQLSGLMAIVGHIFPFYLKFRGGQGVAAATGMLLYYLVSYFVLKPIFFLFMFYLLIIVGIFYYISRIGNLLGVMVLPLLGYAVFLNFPGNQYNLFFWIILGQIVAIGIINIIERGSFKIEDETFKTHWWRVAIRPFAILFIIFYVFNPHLITLELIGIVALFFIAFDIYRFMSKQANELIAKKVKALLRKNEFKKFSSMTIFLVSMFITILLFQKNIAIIASSFLIFGDSFSKLFGLAFGKHKILDKSLEGSLAYLGSALIMGYILYANLEISLVVLIIGAASAPIIEILSVNINDNLTVPLISGAIMTALLLFGF